ncbi:hypothetical protein FPCIR_5332 [Fusarium pseudocircinatum]|uniref:Uncharacterized protein n=1 Tax=Fusarium pseudocircinatum TaxID=56676 RepID=A0A8H5UMS5_9HYPO|nr:hypothetical protein FPCIR_5332 [Fusarium pseudocircinatum]
MSNPRDPVIIVIDDDDVPILPPQAPPLRSPPRQGISCIEAIEQTGHVAERPPRSILFTEASLTRDELRLFIDLAQKMHEVEEGRDVPYELKHWRDFWEQKAFKDWDTKSGNTDDLPLRPVTLQENRVKVGNHPSGIKEISGLDIGCRNKLSKSAEYPGPPGPYRLRYCPVYMSVSPAAGLNQLLVPMWKDERGRFVNPRYVEMELSLGDALDQAILRFDRNAESRIEEYNIACITNAARRRLMHFAAVGTGVAPIPRRLSSANPSGT